MEKKKILVSGASSGIGYALAKQFDSMGHQVLAIARREPELIRLKAACTALDYLVLDLGTDESEASYKEKIKDWDRIDVLVNNAGQLINVPFMETSLADFEQQMNANLYTAIRLSQWSYAKLLLSDIAHVVNISSMGGFQGSSKFHGLSAYSTSKGALSVFTECLAAEWAESNISVNALALGAVQTEMLAAAFPSYKAPLSPEEIAEYIARFALREGKYYHGKVLPVALGNP